MPEEGRAMECLHPATSTHVTALHRARTIRIDQVCDECHTTTHTDFAEETRQ